MSDTRKLTWGALFIALGILLPMLFHTTGIGGAVFLPMHIPVLLCGFFTGPGIGLLVGGVTPLLSSLLTGMPPMMPPVAQRMVFELAAFGFMTGFLFNRLHLGVYPSLIGAMLVGRLVYGLVGYLLLPLVGLEGIPILYPLTHGLVTGLPGIALQLVLIPAVVYLLSRYPGLAPARGEGS